MKSQKTLMFISALSVLTLASCSTIDFNFPSVSIPEASTTTSATEGGSEGESAESTPTESGDKTSSESKSSSSSSETKTSSSSSSFDVDPGGDGTGFKTGPLKYKVSDFTNVYTPNEGQVNVLVVPLDLSGLTGAGSHEFDTWTEEELEFVNTQYFGTGDVGAPIFEKKTDPKYWTFKDYYESVSGGKVTISGEVAPVYKASGTGINTLLTDSTMSALHKIFRFATLAIQENAPDYDWSKYDLNNDGYFDACHFISNFKGADWGSYLWPHQSQTNKSWSTGLCVNNYSLSSIEMFGNAQTATHEQGHMFGLDDYYDYSEPPTGQLEYNFIGQVDMQVINWFEWNSYSKLVTGWANPTVITGEKDSVTVSLRDAATSGDCLLVPADYSKFNNSPYDEYFLFELFSPKGNNELPWNLFTSYTDLGDYGVRAYHVFAKAAGLNGFEHVNMFNDDGTINSNLSSIYCYSCNSASYVDYGDGLEEYNDFPLLSIVSKSDSSKFLKRGDLWLSKDDMWKQGDTFTFEKAKCALTKGGKARSTMVDGSTFPYEIHFDSMSKDVMTVTVTKK